MELVTSRHRNNTVLMKTTYKVTKMADNTRHSMAKLITLEHTERQKHGVRDLKQTVDFAINKS